MSEWHLFGENKRFDKLSQINDPLEKLTECVDWELFRPTLAQLLKKPVKGSGGRPPYDYVLMFKILILQRYYNLSDDQTEYAILDRLSFRRFLGISEYTLNVPDTKTIWLFKDALPQIEDYDRLFSFFECKLKIQGIISHEGTLIDALFIECPKQHNKRDENKCIKQGDPINEWSNAKYRQKDVDARWTKKNGQS